MSIPLDAPDLRSRLSYREEKLREAVTRQQNNEARSVPKEARLVARDRGELRFEIDRIRTLAATVPTIAADDAGLQADARRATAAAAAAETQWLLEDGRGAAKDSASVPVARTIRWSRSGLVRAIAAAAELPTPRQATARAESTVLRALVERAGGSMAELGSDMDRLA